MICYPSDANYLEICAINDYWTPDEEFRAQFKYSIREVSEKNKQNNVRSISYIASKSLFCPQDPLFKCEDCKKSVPVENRTDYTKKILGEKKTVCQSCSKKREENEIKRCLNILSDFNKENFRRQPYLDELNFEEALSLLCIASEASSSHDLIFESKDSVFITGSKTVDNQIITSLVKKGALVYIHQIPLEVKKANEKIYGKFGHVTYDNEYQRPVLRHHSDSVQNGLFLNPPKLTEETDLSGLTSLLYQKIMSMYFSISDIERIKNIIIEIQRQKLYSLVFHISQEYNWSIDNSNPLRALLDHLAKNYEPRKLYFTFRVKARSSIIYAQEQMAPNYISKHFFTKFVREYIEMIESRDFRLQKEWSLPKDLDTSPLEALFSQIYLPGHFNWNRLSGNDIVASWISHVRLTDQARELLTSDTGEE